MSDNAAAPARRHRLRWRFLMLLARPKLAKAVARIALDGYLSETGWLRTVESGEVVDAEGRPIPWATYPCIDFLGPRLRADWRVFEYGAGASTLFFADRVAEVRAVDHDAEFVRRLLPRLPRNAQVEVRAHGSDEYLAAIAAMDVSPHIVCIDGRDRVRCAAAALQRVAPDGVIIFDDSERPQYAPALLQIRDAGFRRLDFWGISAGTHTRRCTTIFYRSDNVLGI